MFCQLWGLYVLSGKGIYVDALTGKEYPVGPGCVLQRIPGVAHHTYIEPDSDWLEFYFCAGEQIFQALVSLNLVTDISNPPNWTDLIVQKLKDNYKVGASLKQLAEECNIGYETLRKQFPKYFGCSLEKYRIQLRINSAKTLLIDREMPPKEVANKLGYCDVYAFSKQFKQQEGISPSKFVKNIHRY